MLAAKRGLVDSTAQIDAQSAACTLLHAVRQPPPRFGILLPALAISTDVARGKAGRKHLRVHARIKLSDGQSCVSCGCWGHPPTFYARAGRLAAVPFTSCIASRCGRRATIQQSVKTREGQYSLTPSPFTEERAGEESSIGGSSGGFPAILHGDRPLCASRNRLSVS